MSAVTPALMFHELMIQGIEGGEWSVTEQPVLPSTSSIDPFRADVLRRLRLIEEKLGISSSSFSGHTLNLDPSSSVLSDSGRGQDNNTEENEQHAAGLPDVRPALQTLVAWSSDEHNEGWSTRVVEALWLA
jgi:hypothetical protein